MPLLTSRMPRTSSCTPRPVAAEMGKMRCSGTPASVIRYSLRAAHREQEMVSDRRFHSDCSSSM